MFFGLSGFLIASVLLGYRIYSIPRALIKFYVRRALRIFPAYYFVLLCGCILGWSGVRGNLLYHITYTTNFAIFKWDDWSFSGSSGVFWSLAVEEQFYLLIPFIVLLINSKNIKWFLALLLVLSFLSILLLCGYGISDLRIYMLPSSHVFELALGALTAYLIHGDQKLASRYLFPAWFTLTIFFASIMAYVVNAEGIYNTLAYYISNAMLLVVEMQIIVLCVASGKKSGLVRILELPPLAALGKISYSIYLYHNFYQDFFRDTWLDYSGIHSIYGGVIYILTPVFLGYASYLVIERPFNDLKSLVRV